MRLRREYVEASAQCGHLLPELEILNGDLLCLRDSLREFGEALVERRGLLSECARRCTLFVQLGDCRIVLRSRRRCCVLGCRARRRPGGLRL